MLTEPGKNARFDPNMDYNRYRLIPQINDINSAKDSWLEIPNLENFFVVLILEKGKISCR